MRYKSWKCFCCHWHFIVSPMFHELLWVIRPDLQQITRFHFAGFIWASFDNISNEVGFILAIWWTLACWIISFVWLILQTQKLTTKAFIHDLCNCTNIRLMSRYIRQPDMLMRYSNWCNKNVMKQTNYSVLPTMSRVLSKVWRLFGWHMKPVMARSGKQII